jgi:REP element-mobilizing transposase RayT
MANSILQPGQFYHIYNRGINSEVLFKHPDYYTEFLELYAKYINPVADTLAYCLMSNHFHLLIRTKEVHEIQTLT